MKQRLFQLLVVLMVLFVGLMVSCDDHDGDDADADGSSDEDDHDDDDAGHDTVSSATPGSSSVLLTSSHAAWGQAACNSCHPGSHNSADFSDSACVNCHGTNGAPERAPGHAASGCAACHADRHPDSGYAADNDCTMCHRYVPTDECPAEESFDVVVIGAGGGGLSAAVTLAMAGMKVAVIEKHYHVGGLMSCFRRGEYEFETSLHGFDGLEDPGGINVDIFKRLGIWDRVERLRPDPIYHAIYPDLELDVPIDAEAYRQLLKETFPAESEGIDMLWEDLAAIDSLMPILMQLQKEITPELILNLMSNWRGLWLYMQYQNTSLTDFLNDYISDQRLFMVFTQLAAFLGAEPDRQGAILFAVMWTSYHHHGYYYFTGGSGAVTRELAEVVEENGGLIKTGTLVTKIDIEDGSAVRVRTDGGACYAARYVVSNANAPDTVFKLIGRENLPEDYVAQIESMVIGLSTFNVYMGVDTDYRDVFGSTHEIMPNESWDQDQIFRWILEGDPEKAPFAICNYTMIDPTTAPAGKSTIVITAMLPFDFRENWGWDKTHTDYDALKNEVGMIYVRRAEKYLPGLSEHIEVMEVGTPVTMRGFSNNPRGSIFGWDMVLGQIMLNRLPKETPIDNIFLAGAWTFPGGGQSAVMQSGVMAADAILKLEDAQD